MHGGLAGAGGMKLWLKIIVGLAGAVALFAAFITFVEWLERVTR